MAKKSRPIGTLEKDPKTKIYKLRIVVKSIRVPDGKGGWKYRQVKKTCSTGTTNKVEAEKFRASYTIPLQAKTKAERINKLKHEIEDIKQQIAEDEKKQPALKVSEALETYLDGQPDLADGTRKVYTERWNRFVRFVDKRFGKGVAEMRQITPEIAEDFEIELKKTTQSATYNGYLMLFRLLWRKLKKKAKIETDPWADFENRHVVSRTRRNLTVEETKRVFEAAKGDWKILIALGLYTGMRLIDCCHLDWSAVNLKERTVKVIPQKSKKRLPLPFPIPLHPDLYKLLIATPIDKRHGKVIQECSDAYDNGSANYKIKRLFESCGIVTNEMGANGRKASVASFHSYRSFFCSWGLAHNISLCTLQALVGHANSKMTEHYIRTTDNDVSKCINVLPSLYDETEKQAQTITIDSSVYELLKSKLLPSETMDEGIMRILKSSEFVKTTESAKEDKASHYPIVPISRVA